MELRQPSVFPRNNSHCAADVDDAITERRPGALIRTELAFKGIDGVPLATDNQSSRNPDVKAWSLTKST